MKILLFTAVWFLVVCASANAAGKKSALGEFSDRQTRVLYSNYLRGAFNAAHDNYKGALDDFQRVKTLDKEAVQPRLKTAVLLLRMGKAIPAEAELKAARKIDPDNADVSLALIFLYSYTQNDSALEAEYGWFLEKAHALKPENIKISEYLAQFYFYKHRTDEAIKVYEVLTAAHPKYVEGMFWLGYLYAESGRRAQAVDVWLNVLKLDNTHAPTLNSLGYIYTEDGVKLEEAEGMIKKALEKEPENGAYLDSLGWLYFKRKKYKLADEYLNKALVLLKDPIVYEHLGDVWVGAGDTIKAVNYYRQGAKYFPGNKTLEEKINKYGAEDKAIKK